MRSMPAGGAARSCSAATTKVGTAIAPSSARRSNVGQAGQASPVGRRRHAGHGRGRARDAGGSGASPIMSATSTGASSGMVRPSSSGPRRWARNVRWKLPSALPNTGLVATRASARQRSAWGRHHLERDHAAHRMADQIGALDPQLIEQPRQRVGERRKRHLGKRGRPAIARHVPGDGAPARTEMGELGLKHRRAAADAVQEQERRSAAALLEMRHRRHHASSPISRPCSTTGTPSSVTVQPRIGRSKWPSVKRPAASLAPVE